jgi:2-octaprenyl-6-methoxyphenol hydroxylase/2-octaprenylphenol hydroxylase
MIFNHAAQTDYDVLIAGGGMVGASLAAILAAGIPSLRVAIVERFPAGESPWQPSFDARATALSSGSVSIFERIGVWSQIAQHACAITAVHVSQRGHWGSTLMQAHEHGMPALGYVVENAWLGRSLLARLRALSNVTIISPAQVAAIKPAGYDAVVDIDTGEERKSLRVQLCVIADGADSALAKRLGMTSEISEYAQTAIIATVATQKPHAGIAYERFTDTSPLAMLPLEDAPGGEHRSALVLTLRDDELPAWRDAGDAEFLRLLQQRFGQRLGRLVKIGSRSIYPLRLTCVSEQARAHIIVLGNAAHSLHPVAGQGFNLALRDADALTEVVSGALRGGKSCGDLALLLSYVERQQRDQQRTILFSDGLPKLFAQPQLQMIAGRVLGLVGLDLVMPAQRAFVRFAAGLAEREARP